LQNTITNKNFSNIARKSHEKKPISSNNRKIYYSFFTILLIICSIQALRGVYININKYFVLKKQIYELRLINGEAVKKNQDLKKQIHDYTSSKGIEALARDNLKMVGKDEVLVVIKEPAPQSKQ